MLTEEEQKAESDYWDALGRKIQEEIDNGTYKTGYDETNKT